MKNQRSILLVLSSCGMVLSCFYACTSFIFACLSQKPVSVFEATMILLVASLITYIHNQRGWRRIYVSGLHLMGFLSVFLGLCHRYYELDLPFWCLGWITELFMHERVAAEWPILILILLCVWVLWFCGIRMITRPTDQAKISHRFDLGLAFLLLLLLIKLIIAVKGVFIPMEHSSTKSIISFFILGLFSMGLVHTRSPSQTGGVIYLKGAGIALTFTFVTLMLGGGLFILFLPKLQTFAEASFGLLGTVKRPMEQILIALSRVFLESGFRRKLGEGPTGDLLPAINRSGGEFGILHYLFIGITITILLAMAGFILYRLLKWLFLKIKCFFLETVEEKDKKGIWELLIIFIYSAKNLFSILWNKILDNPDTPRSAEKFYKRLLRWGRFSGLGHAATETPKEYGIRLGNRFPQIKKEIKYIIHMHDEAIYGSIFPDRHQTSRARLALKRIRNPLLWFARIKSLCFENRF